jgi:hypothetical protein
MSVQGELNEARAAAVHLAEELAAARAAYDRLLHRCRYAEGVVRDLAARAKVAADSLDVKP